MHAPAAPPPPPPPQPPPPPPPQQPFHSHWTCRAADQRWSPLCSCRVSSACAVARDIAAVEARRLRPPGPAPVDPAAPMLPSPSCIDFCEAAFSCFATWVLRAAMAVTVSEGPGLVAAFVCVSLLAEDVALARPRGDGAGLRCLVSFADGAAPLAACATGLLRPRRCVYIRQYSSASCTAPLYLWPAGETAQS
eukprot:SAG25_NODE_1556_length_2767_cov_661.423538_2_plen_193_part_00